MIYDQYLHYIQENCYVIYHDKAVCITDKMITSDKEKAIETIVKELEKIK